MGLLAIAMLLCAACAAPEQEPEQEMHGHRGRRLAHVWAGERRGDHHARGGADKRACLRI